LVDLQKWKSGTSKNSKKVSLSRPISDCVWTSENAHRIGRVNEPWFQQKVKKIRLKEVQKYDFFNGKK
jgi:hypothetical protein